MKRFGRLCVDETLAPFTFRNKCFRTHMGGGEHGRCRYSMAYFLFALVPFFWCRGVGKSSIRLGLFCILCCISWTKRRWWWRRHRGWHFFSLLHSRKTPEEKSMYQIIVIYELGKRNGSYHSPELFIYFCFDVFIRVWRKIVLFLYRRSLAEKGKIYAIAVFPWEHYGHMSGYFFDTHSTQEKSSGLIYVHTLHISRW